MASAAIVGFSAQPSAAAPIQVGQYAKFFDGVGNGPGGQFTLKIYDKDANGNYVWTGDQVSTYCVEKDEYIDYSSYFYIDTISQTVWKGGANTDLGDPLSGATQWLFEQATLGQLAGYNSNNASHADALQNVIWYLEGESTLYAGLSGNVGSYGSEQYWAKQWYDLAMTHASYSTGAVLALNLKTAPGGTDAQSQIFHQVPEPGWIALALTGALGSFVRGRRRRAR